jgi:hypothetical protein
LLVCVGLTGGVWVFDAAGLGDAVLGEVVGVGVAAGGVWAATGRTGAELQAAAAISDVSASAPTAVM